MLRHSCILSTVAALVFLCPLASGLAEEAAVMKVGFAETDITPAVGTERPGGYGKSYHQSIHDPCKVRAVVFDDGRMRVAIASVDALALHREMVLAVRKAVHQQCGIEPEAILVCASHSHSSGPVFGVRPGQYDDASPLVKKLAYEMSTGVDPEYYEQVQEQIIAALCRANESRVDALCGVGKGVEDRLAVNRRLRTKNGPT